MRGDGGVIWVQTRSAVEEYRDGTRSVLGVVRDITAEVRSRERDRLLATLVESTDDAMMTTDLTESITSWNPGAERLYGISADEAVGRHLSFITGQLSDPEQAAEQIDDQTERIRHVASGENIRHLLLHRHHKDGSPFIMSASASPLRDDAGNIVGVALVAQDVTELEEAHAEIRASEERFRALVQRGSDLIGLIEADGTLRYISPSLLAVSGRDPQEVVGRRFTEFAHPDDAQGVEALLELLVRSPGSRVNLTYRIVHKDGGVRHLDAVATNLIDLPEVRGVVFNARDVTEAVEYREQLAHQALHDPLTGLANRALLVDRIGQGLQRDAQGGRAILLLDVDNFQAVNDAFGYSVGDEVLIGLGQRLSQLARTTDTVARLGGDRFAIWCEQCSADVAREFADRVVRTAGEPFTADHHDVSITASVGVALDPGDRPVHVEGLLRDVNVATLQAKERGRDRFEVFDVAMSGAAKSRIELRSELLTALREGQLVVYYQPEVRLADERTVGTEALVRWLHPERGLILPMQFIPAAEDSDLILAIGRWVLEVACRDAATWPETAGPLTVAVNLSARQFTDPDLLEHITDALTSSGLPANRLCLEVTETLLMRDVERTAELLEVIKGLGVLTAIDDFGTGYSSLAYLTRLPVDYLKVDRVFVEGLDRGLERSETVASAVVGLAQRLGIRTIAEGVETEAQAAAVRRLGCDLVQGFLYGRPMPHEDFLDRIAAG
ncbi:MAG: EAL domain-containing protein [Acidimicrobiales bacterium]